jgi:acyl carrier protein
MERIKDVIVAVFPDANVAALAESSRLCDIPEWDSLKSISFGMRLSQEFGVNLRAFPFGPDHTLGDVMALLRGRGATL